MSQSKRKASTAIIKQFYRCCMDVGELPNISLFCGPLRVFCMQMMQQERWKNSAAVGFREDLWCCPSPFKEQGPAAIAPRRTGSVGLCFWLTMGKPTAGSSLPHGNRCPCLLLTNPFTISRIQLLEGQLQSQALLGSDSVTRRKGRKLRLEGSRSDVKESCIPRRAVQPQD